MAIKEILTKLKSMVTGDNADAVKSEIDKAIDEFETFEESKRKADAESKSRKLELTERDRLIEQQNAEIEKLKTANPDIEVLKQKAAKHDQMVSEQQASRAKQWTERSAIFALPETDKRKANMDKLKPKFHFAEEGKTLTDEQIAHNLNLYETLELAGAFGEIKPIEKPDPRPNPMTGDKAQTSGQALFTNKQT